MGNSQQIKNIFKNIDEEERKKVFTKLCIQIIRKMIKLNKEI